MSKGKLALKLPFCDDVRYYKKGKLIEELRLRGLPTEGSKDLLTARLLHVLVSSERLFIDPKELDDEQPEKWLHYMSTSRSVLDQLKAHESDGVRSAIAADASNALVSNGIYDDRAALIAYAEGKSRFQDKSDLFNAFVQNHCALNMYCFVQERLDKGEDLYPVNLRGAGMFFLWRCGLVELPKHYTVEGVLDFENKKSEVLAHPIRIDDRTTVKMGQQVVLELLTNQFLPYVVVGVCFHSTTTTGQVEQSAKRQRLEEPPVRVVVLLKANCCFGGGDEISMSVEEYLEELKKSNNQELSNDYC